MRDKKIEIIEYLYIKNIINLPVNEVELLLKKYLSKQYFGEKSLYRMYVSRGFNYHCQIGSFLCSLNSPLPCKLIRGELLPNIKGEEFIHGWIETTYKGKKYIIDTTFAKVIPKELYYKLFSPKIVVTVDRNDLFINKYALYLKKTLTRKNDLSLEKVYSCWWQYEDKWLTNIDDNTLFNKKKKPIALRRVK